MFVAVLATHVAKIISLSLTGVSTSFLESQVVIVFCRVCNERFSMKIEAFENYFESEFLCRSKLLMMVRTKFYFESSPDANIVNRVI